MKRQKRKAKAQKKSTPVVMTDAPKQESKPKVMSRRNFLGNSVFYTAGIAALAGGGWYFTNSMAVSARESDLSVIGNGIPTIVHVHDPSCPTCNALRCEAREAVGSFDEGTVQFLVANIKTPEGQAIASQHGVGKITLLLFDGAGNVQTVLPGMNEAENLVPVFERHLRRYGPKA